MPQQAILIAGPTASGKSSLAVDVAQSVGGVVINADSMQVYDELRILTARPSEADEALVPHRLFGHVSAASRYSAGHWLEDAGNAIREAHEQGRVPVIAGGTGLYFKLLLEGVAPVPEIPENVRNYWRAKAESDGAGILHKILGARDPVMAARLEPGDTQRLVRALEVLEATGKSLAEWQLAPVAPPLIGGNKFTGIVIAPEREVLYERLEARFDAMIDQGALEEAETIRELGPEPNCPAMKALGLRELIAHLGGKISLEEAASQAKTKTRRYAKRQMTWLKSNMIAWKWLDTQDMESKTEKIFAIIRKARLTGDS